MYLSPTDDYNTFCLESMRSDFSWGEKILTYMKSLAPSAVDAEYKSLCTNDEDDHGMVLLKYLFVWLLQQMNTGNNFELLQVYLYRALLIYSEVLRKNGEFNQLLMELKDCHESVSKKFRGLIQSNLCLLKLFGKINFN